MFRQGKGEPGILPFEKGRKERDLNSFLDVGGGGA